MAVERVRFVRNITLYAAFLLVLATLCVGVFWFVLHSREVALLQGPPGYVNMRGTYVPNVTLTDLQGKRYSLRHLKQPMVLEIFATWCPECQKEVAVLNRIATSRHDVTVLAVTGDDRGQRYQPEALSDVKAYMRHYGVKYAVMYDNPVHIATLFHTVAFPNIIVIRKDGTIEYNMMGAMPFEGITAAIADGIKDEGIAVRGSVQMSLPSQ